MAPLWWAAKPGTMHLWTHHPADGSPALCGEYVNWEKKPVDEHPMVKDGYIEGIRHFLRLYIVCEGCKEEVKRRYYPEEVSA